jgi:hypothetical protein
MAARVIKARPEDPFHGTVTFTAVRSGPQAGQVEWSCTSCGSSQWNVNGNVARELAARHVADHGLLIPSSYGRPERVS